MNRYPALEVRRHRRRAGGRPPLHAAEFLPRSAGGAGLDSQGQRQGRRRAARHGRGRAQGGQHPVTAAQRSTPTGIKVRFDDTDTQLKAKDVLQAEARRQLHRRAEPPVVVAALAGVDRRAADVPRPRPARRRALPAAGRHEGARSTRRPTATPTDIRIAAARQEDPVRRHRARRRATSSCASATTPSATKARIEIEQRPIPTSPLREADAGAASSASSRRCKPEAQKRIQDGAVQQNIQILRNRVNELGVAEPIVQQQGADRIVVQLPGVQDTARAKDILGRTATLEIRMVNDDPGALEAALAGQRAARQRPLHRAQRRASCSSRRQVVLTGDRINDAQPGFDQRNNEPAVHVNLDGTGARIFKRQSRARTSASAWRSCWSRRARPRSSPRR